MGIRTLVVNVISGGTSAVIIHLLVQMLLWVVSFGPTFGDYLIISALLLPIPLVLGVAAGILVTAMCRSICATLSVAIAITGLLGAIASIALGFSGLTERSLTSQLTPIMFGMVTELMGITLVLVGSYIHRKLRTLSSLGPRN